MGWVPAGADYEVSVDRWNVARRRARAKALRIVHMPLREQESGIGLRQLVEWLRRHETTCRAEAERWMTRSLPVPSAVIAQLWADETWRALLHDAVIVPVSADGTRELGAAGLLRDADVTKGLGVVDLDGESARLSAATVAVPHPVLLPDLDDLREFAADLGVEQSLVQLFREVWRKPPGEAEQRQELRRYAGLGSRSCGTCSLGPPRRATGCRAAQRSAGCGRTAARSWPPCGSGTATRRSRRRSTS